MSVSGALLCDMRLIRTMLRLRPRTLLEHRLAMFGGVDWSATAVPADTQLTIHVTSLFVVHMDVMRMYVATTALRYSRDLITASSWGMHRTMPMGAMIFTTCELGGSVCLVM